MIYLGYTSKPESKIMQNMRSSGLSLRYWRVEWGSIPRAVKSDTVSPTARNRCNVLRSCVAKAVSCGDRPHSLHASAWFFSYLTWAGILKNPNLPQFSQIVDTFTSRFGIFFIASTNSSWLRTIRKISYLFV